MKRHTHTAAAATSLIATAIEELWGDVRCDRVRITYDDDAYGTLRDARTSKRECHVPRELCNAPAVNK